jgi:hypothetical protein
MSRDAQQMSLSPVNLRTNGDVAPAMPHMANKCSRVEDELPPMNNGDHTSGAVVLVNERRSAAGMEHHVQVGLVLNFSSTSAVPWYRACNFFYYLCVACASTSVGNIDVNLRSYFKLFSRINSGKISANL